MILRCASQENCLNGVFHRTPPVWVPVLFARKIGRSDAFVRCGFFFFGCCVPLADCPSENAIRLLENRVDTYSFSKYEICLEECKT